MKAIIMAGGEGTRLRPLTGSIPKPLAKLCGRPTIYYILDLLALHGCKEAVFTLRYKGEMIERLFESESYKGIHLSFSYEDEPLGTAGCVKKAAENFTDDFIVISGDALCDFNLSKAFEFHKNNRAEATIITKQVTDPREYGLVISQNHRICGFSEKPSYLNCVSDYANTGVYFLNPSVLSLIPNGKMWDFARDVFPRMLKDECVLMSYDEKGYWCDVGDIGTYTSSQQDILNGLVKCEIGGRRIADGVYTNVPIPENVMIISPCYIGRNVKIGENTVIEGGIIGDNVNIGRGCRVYSSVILDNSMLANDCNCVEAVVCENVKLKKAVTMLEGSIVGEGSVIGEKSTIHNDVKIWQNKDISPSADVHCDVKYGTKTKIEISERGISGDTNIDITPDFAAKVGCALNGLNANNILVACDKNNTSISLKNALLSGISSTGSKSSDCAFATIPMLIHLSKLMSADIIVHISALSKTHIIILNQHGLALTRMQERQLESGINRSEYRSASWDEFGEVSNINCPEELYLSMLNHMSKFKTKYNIILNCNNHRIVHFLSPLFERISNKTGEQLVITLNSSGTKAEFNFSKDGKLNFDKLILLACVDILKGGFDVSLPADFPSAADFLAESFGRKIHRFFSCSNDNSDKTARKIAESEAFLWDGAYLSLFVLGWVTRENITLNDAANALPEFNRENRVVIINCPPQRILGKLCGTDTGIGEGIIIDRESNRVLLRSNKKGNALFLLAESASQETAKALCDDVEAMVKKLMHDN